VKDETLDKKPLEISGYLQKMCSKLLNSAKNPYGSFDGPLVTFGPRSTFTCTPPGLLAAARMLQQKDVLIRKITYGRDSKIKPLTAHELLEQFFTIFNLKGSKGLDSYAVKLIRGILHSSIKLVNKGFPGGFVHSNRVNNKVKGDASLLTVLGWTPLVPSSQRILDVLFNTVDDSYGLVDGKNKVIARSLQNISKRGRDFSHQEFRTAVFLTVPKLDFSSDVSLEKQLDVNPLDSKMSPNVARAYSDQKVSVVVNNLQQAYAFKVSLEKPKTKTTLTLYENKRNKLLNSTANLSILDARGKKYQTFSELPEKCQHFLRKKYRYPNKKRALSSDGTEEVAVVAPFTGSGGVPLEATFLHDIEMVQSVPDPVAPLPKKQKMTKKQASDSRKVAGNSRITRSKSTKK